MQSGDRVLPVSDGRRRAAAGLTLIEFLFAISIMAVAALGVAGMFPAALRSVVTGGNTTKATALAREMAEMIRADAARPEMWGEPNTPNLISVHNGTNTSTMTYNCLTGTPSTRSPQEKWKCDLAATAAQDSGSGLPAGYGTVAVACINPSGTVIAGTCLTDLRRVTVTVFWERNASRSVSVVTNVARPN